MFKVLCATSDADPAYVAEYLRLGGEIFGIDLSPRMIEVARRRYPAIPFQVGDLRALDLPTDSVRGIVAFYSIIHFRRDAVVPVLREMGAHAQQQREPPAGVPSGTTGLSCR